MPQIRTIGLRFVGYSLAVLAIASSLSACGGGSAGGTTPPTVQAGPTWELMTAGDIAQCLLFSSSGSNAQKTAELVERQLASAGANANVLTLGDNAYVKGTIIGYTQCYKPRWGRFLDKTFVVPGNHDYENGGQNEYFDYFGAKASPGPSFGPDRSGYYRIDRNGWTVFTLNSNIEAGAASAQAQWLKAQLATAKPCIAAAWHHPRFSSAARGDNALMQDMWEILDLAKADLILAAHEHHYERFAPMTSTGAVVAGGGIRSFVVGSGGAEKYGFATVRANSQKQHESYGVMRLSLSDGKAGWKFIDIDNNTLDQGAFDCRAK